MLNKIMFKLLCKHNLIFMVLFVRSSYHKEMKKGNFTQITNIKDEDNIDINRTESYNNSQSSTTTKTLVTTTTGTWLREKLLPENVTENHKNSQSSSTTKFLVTIVTGTPLRKKPHGANVTGSYNNSQSSAKTKSLVTISTDLPLQEKLDRVNVTENYNNSQSDIATMSLVATTTETMSQEFYRESISKSYNFGNPDHNISQYEHSMDTVVIDMANTTPLLKDNVTKNFKRLITGSPSETYIDRRANYLRQDGPPPGLNNRDGPGGFMQQQLQQTLNPAAAAANRFTARASTTQSKRTMTKAFRLTFEDTCDTSMYYCMAAYQTGTVCGRTLYYVYYDFRTFCHLDYVNCRARYEVWTPIHMGSCRQNGPRSDWHTYKWYQYNDDSFLDEYHVMDDFSY